MALEMAAVSWLYLLYKCSENSGLCAFCALLAQKLLTEQTELNRELCTALHCSTRFFCTESMVRVPIAQKSEPSGIRQMICWLAVVWR